MSMQRIELEIPHKPYSLNSVTSHGWYVLAPNHWDFETETLRRVERLSDGTIFQMFITQQRRKIVVELDLDNLTDEHEAAIRSNVRWILGLDEDLTVFYQLCEHHGSPWTSVATIGLGRLLRSPTLFEDVVKTICTTNINWVQTKAMVQRIVDTLGSPHPVDSTLKAFPTASQFHAASDAVFEQDIRLGYRNAYVQQLAAEVVSGERDLEGLKTQDWTSPELKKQLKQIKGVGNYAAHTLLMLLGHYDQLAVDSELTAFIRKKYLPDAEKITPQSVDKIYKGWGDWKYLAYWFDKYEP